MFSSDQQNQEGVLKAPSDPGIVGAAKGQTLSIVGTEEFAADSQARVAPTEFLKTFVPLRGVDGSVFGVVEIDQYYSTLRDAASHPWFQVGIAFASIALLCLVMAGVSLRWVRSEAAPDSDGHKHNTSAQKCSEVIDEPGKGDFADSRAAKPPPSNTIGAIGFGSEWCQRVRDRRRQNLARTLSALPGDDSACPKAVGCAHGWVSCLGVAPEQWCVMLRVQADDTRSRLLEHHP